MAGVSQSRLAGIEAGRVDLRASTLVQIARALELELFLVPRQSLLAVQSLVRSTAGAGTEVVDASRAKIRRSLQRIRRRLLDLQGGESPSPVRARAQNALSLADSVTLYQEWLQGSDLQPLLRIERSLKRAGVAAAAEVVLVQVVTGLRELDQRAVRESSKVREPPFRPQRAAYSLEDQEDR